MTFSPEGRIVAVIDPATRMNPADAEYHAALISVSEKLRDDRLTVHITPNGQPYITMGELFVAPAIPDLDLHRKREAILDALTFCAETGTSLDYLQRVFDLYATGYWAGEQEEAARGIRGI